MDSAKQGIRVCGVKTQGISLIEMFNKTSQFDLLYHGAEQNKGL